MCIGSCGTLSRTARAGTTFLFGQPQLNVVSFVPGSRVSKQTEEQNRPPAPASISSQLLGAGGESGSSGRISCAPSLLLFIRGPRPPLASLPHRRAALGVEGGLHRTSSKGNEQHGPSSVLLILVQTCSLSTWLCRTAPQTERCWVPGSNPAPRVPTTTARPQVLKPAETQ